VGVFKFSAWLVVVLAWAAVAQGEARPPKRAKHGCCAHCERRLQREQARAAAAEATGGEVVGMHRVTLNGSWGGYEVKVRMPGQDKGWRLLVDLYPVRVRDRYVIPNPEGPALKAEDP